LLVRVFFPPPRFVLSPRAIRVEWLGGGGGGGGVGLSLEIA